MEGATFEDTAHTRKWERDRMQKWSPGVKHVMRMLGLEYVPAALSAV